MSDLKAGSSGNKERKIFENPFVGSLIVPIAIVLVGALIIFGVTKMLSTDRSYKDLVREMHSKTFGNRWIAAYELSKVIASSKIPDEEMPWLINNLTEVYTKSVDPRTKRFIVAAIGALRSNLGVPLLVKALEEKDPEIQFHAVVSLGNMQNIGDYDWSPLIALLDSEDLGLKQAALLTLGTHKVKASEAKMLELLSAEQLSIRFAAATALIPFKSNQAIPVVKEILFLSPEQSSVFDVRQISSLKLNVLNSIKKTGWKELSTMVADVVATERDVHVAGVAREVLNQLKK